MFPPSGDVASARACSHAPSAPVQRTQLLPTLTRTYPATCAGACDTFLLAASSSSRRSELRAADIGLIALQAARGLTHLLSKGVAHRDVACRNIFCAAQLDGDQRLCRTADGCVAGLRAVVADFGRAVSLPVSRQPGTLAMGTVRLKTQPLRDQPPEVLMQKVFCATSDVFSLGVSMWVMSSGQEPWSTRTPLQAAQTHVAGRRMEPPSGPLAHPMLDRVMQRCWHQDPARRPPLREVCAVLEQTVEALQEDDKAKEQARLQAQERGRAKLASEYGHFSLDVLSIAVENSTTAADQAKEDGVYLPFEVSSDDGARGLAP